MGLSSLLLLLGLAQGMVLKDPASIIKPGSIPSPKAPTGTWSPSSWRTKEARQIPKYEDQEALAKAEADLRKCAPLVFAGEIRSLSNQLAQASLGNAFVLFGGDCAESFEEFSTNHIRDTFRVILQMALILTHGGGKPVIKIGRIRPFPASIRASL